MKPNALFCACGTAFFLLWGYLVFAQTSTPATPPSPPAAAHPKSAPAGSAISCDSGQAALSHYLDRMAETYLAGRTARVEALRNLSDAKAYQEQIRRKMLLLIGGLPEPTPLNAKVLGETKIDGFSIRKVIFESQPNFPVSALLYLPSSMAEGQKHPAILITPGHAPGGKSSDAATALAFARNGFVVLSYDPIGEGERLQYPDPAHPGKTIASGPTGEHAEASLQPLLIGDTLARYMVWDAMRGIDYLTQLPEVDPKRIGAFGCSGGGTITALLGALDTRVAALGVACYITSFHALLPTLGPQDAEQSTPRWISSGLDFPDWIEAAAPRPYAVISTYSDMFPFAGARASVAEARRFYALFNTAGSAEPIANASALMPSTPTEPALNVDMVDTVSSAAPLQFITGPGRHSALAPIMDKILSFFLHNLEPSVDADHPMLSTVPTGADEISVLRDALSKGSFQVTPTGQVATSYPRAETVFTLNRKRAAELIPDTPRMFKAEELARVIRSVTGATATPAASRPAAESAETNAESSGPILLRTSDGLDLQAEIATPASIGRHLAVILLVPDSIHGGSAIAHANRARFEALAAAGNVVLAFTPRTSPSGTDAMKSPLLGPFYLLGLRADLVGRTLLGLRIDDIIQAVDFVVNRPDVDPTRISAIASGHLGLVLQHAAVLDARLKHIAIDHALASYRSLLDAPLPIGAPEDIVPGVLLHYDLPDLAHILGPRLTETNSLNGGDDLSQSSTPIQDRTHPRR